MSGLRYMPALDGLRGLAVSCVLAEHFFVHPLVKALHLGSLGVKLFFVLSGYLITLLLLGYDRGVPLRHSAAHFYWRRFVRLAPAYYIAILSAAFLGLKSVENDWIIHSLYLTNFSIALKGEWVGASHFWTLGVEEQFYILWFIVVLACPRRKLLLAILAAMATSTIYRLLIHLSGVSHLGPGPGLLLPGSVDGFATGALVAYAARPHCIPRVDAVFRDPRAFALAAVATVLAHAHQAWMPWELAANACAACLVKLAAERVDGLPPALAFLVWPWLIHLGKISYGVYVYHYFVPDLVIRFWPDYEPFLRNLPLGLLVHVLVCTIISLGIAQLSWSLIEKRALACKEWAPFGTATVARAG